MTRRRPPKGTIGPPSIADNNGSVISSPTRRDADVSGGEAPLLEIENLRIVSEATGHKIVDDVSFAVAPGETIALVGESGSGKSMIAKSIIGLLPNGVRSNGAVRLDGRNLLALPEREMRRIRGSDIGMILQDPFTLLNPMTTAGTHLTETLRARPGVRRPSRRDLEMEARRRLAEVGIAQPEAASRYPFELSGGMRQRVGIAAGVARNPRLLIADEPTTALDATTQQGVLRLLRQIQRERNMALLLITHDLRVAFAIADRVLVVYAGRILEAARPADLVSGPAHPYTFGLLSAEPAIDRTQQVLTGIPGNVPPADQVASQCAFASRCQWAEDDCRASRPPLSTIGPSRSTACIRYPQLADALSVDAAPAVSPGRVDAEPPAASGGSVHPAPAAETDAAGPILTVHGLGKRYGSRRSTRRSEASLAALDNVDLELFADQSVGIVGETGSGKTTLARCLLGLERPSQGTMTLQDMDITRFDRLKAGELARARSAIQCVFQDPYSSLNPSHSVGFILAEAIRHRSKETGSGRVDVTDETARLLKEVGLPVHYAGRRPVALSGGERQRVAIARALAMRPRILVCDEPVAALDVSVQAQVLEVLRAVRRSGVSLLFITHDLAVVRQMTEYLVVLYKGSVVERGATVDVLRAPKHPYTRRLIDAVPRAEPEWLG